MILPVGLAGSWVVGSMAVLGINWNVLTIMITALTIGLGIDYSIHVWRRFESNRASGMAIWPAMRDMYAHTGSALLMSAGTTICGFMVLLLSPIPVIRDFGVVTHIGGLLAYPCVAGTAGPACGRGSDQWKRLLVQKPNQLPHIQVLPLARRSMAISRETGPNALLFLSALLRTSRRSRPDIDETMEAIFANGISMLLMILPSSFSAGSSSEAGLHLPYQYRVTRASLRTLTGMGANPSREGDLGIKEHGSRNPDSPPANRPSVGAHKGIGQSLRKPLHLKGPHSGKVLHTHSSPSAERGGGAWRSHLTSGTCFKSARRQCVDA